MNAPKWLLYLALIALIAAPALAEENSGTSGGETVTAQTQTTQTEPVVTADDFDDEWLNTVWTQVDDIVKSEEHKLQETVTVAGVRGAEAEDAILDKLYYRGAKRYPSQDKLNKAIETLKKAVASSPKSDSAPMQKYFIAQCYEKLGKQAEARDYYGQVSENHPKTTWATKARKDLSRMASAN